jgi:hypothetical protein
MPCAVQAVVSFFGRKIDLVEKTYSLTDLGLITVWEDVEIRLEAGVAQNLLVFLLVPWLTKNSVLADRCVLQ